MAPRRSLDLVTLILNAPQLIRLTFIVLPWDFFLRGLYLCSALTLYGLIVATVAILRVANRLLVVLQNLRRRLEELRVQMGDVSGVSILEG
ncbi:uncharacterized protein CTHT_0013720 [Thermochaetoides thermophila DSM 1495]|uniref:Uncharacterized protein n=1 Tax=Chaetomium thermophilum (strain DSM 1495 / CBS 144.50 / IMI 039719) TaxID=759272 RepID=G0S1I5_CHATD|nr:hypothetical protein CTHT_0013720 [Thermochaetoides thermophila DSM 1495]EGS22895.1 hypothetical protein CTHT_0013720 [Thermochaetoides thermophila DSM 1495]